MQGVRRRGTRNLMLSVMSRPCLPSPRVKASDNSPRMYCRLTAAPSNLGVTVTGSDP